MNDLTPEPQGAPEEKNSDRVVALIVYGLFLVGFVTGISALAGVITAHIKNNDGSGAMRSHFQYQIQTFWIGFVVLILGFALTFILIGWVVLIVWALWTLYRIIKGALLAIDGKPIPR